MSPLTSVTARLRGSLAVALGAHVVLFAWASHVRHEADPVERASEPVTEMDVELVEPSHPADTAAPVEEPSSVRGSPAAIARLDERRAAHALPREGEHATGPEVPLVPSAPGETDGSWTFSPSETPPPAGPLSGTALNDAVRAGVRTTVLEGESAERARRQRLPAFTQRDLDLGLAPGGALATLAKELVRRSRVPTEGRALLRIDSDGAGIVASVHILDVSAGMPEWQELATQLVSEARAKPMKVPTGARGVSVTIEVTSAMKTVDGGKPSHSTAAAIVGAVTDPVDTVIGAAEHLPPVRVVAARVVDVEAF